MNPSTTTRVKVGTGKNLADVVTVDQPKATGREKAKVRPSLFLYIFVALIGFSEYLFIKFTGISLSNEAAGALLMANLLMLSVLAVYKPAKLVIIIIAFFPFHRLLPEFKLGIITFNIYTSAMIILFLFALINNFATSWKKYRITLFDLAIVLFGILSLFSLLLAKDIVESGFLAFHGIFIPVLTYFVVKSFFRGEEDAHELSLVLIFSIGVFALASLQEYAVTHERATTPLDFFVGGATVLFWGGALLMYSGVIRSWFIKLLLGVTIALGLVVTFSRAYLLILLLSPFVVFALRKRVGRLLVIGMLAIGAGLTALAIGLSGRAGLDAESYAKKDQGIERLTNISVYETTFARRGVMWDRGYKKFLESPAIGWGMHSSVPELGSTSRISYHNNYIDWLAYGGVLGLMFQLFFFVRHFQKSDYLKQKSPLLLVNLLVLLAILANGYANGISHGVMPTLVFLLFGLNEVMVSRRRVQEPGVVIAR